MKKTMACLLALTMFLFLALPALAEQALDAALRDVTAQAKVRCGVEDRYTDFEGSRSDMGNRQRWSLYWSDKNGSVSLTCDEQGYPYDFYRYDENASRYDAYYAPRFPDVTREQLEEAAGTFLSGALHENEGYAFDDKPLALSAHSEATRSLTGTLTRDGLPTDITFQMEIDTATLRVSYFYRNDSWQKHVENDGTGTAAISAEEAGRTLKELVRMELQYAPGGEGEATLRYVPVSDGDYTLRADTGELFDWRVLGEGGDLYREAASSMMGGMGDGAGLTEAEIAGAERLADALSREKLDAVARATSELGVTDAFALDRVSYQIEDERVVATLVYVATFGQEGYSSLLGLSEADAAEAYEMNGDMRMTRSVTLDAKDGTLVRCETSGNEIYGPYAPLSDLTKAESTVVSFLQKYFPQRASDLKAQRTDSLTSDSWYHPCAQTTLVRMENGVPFPTDETNVTVNLATGFIDAFNMGWSEHVSFESQEDCIGAEASYNAWSQTVSPRLGWRSLPIQYLEYEYIYDLALCYDLTSEPKVVGIGAKDGLPICETQDGPTAYAYDDLDGEPSAEAAKALATYGVGFPGGSLKADEPVTLREMVCLLLEAGGSFGAWNWNDEILTGNARGESILRGGEELSSALTRGQLCRMLLEMSGYGRAAAVREAFTCDYADAANFSDADYGYYALAQAMGLAEQDESGCLNPDEQLARGEAVRMLSAFLSREY